MVNFDRAEQLRNMAPTSPTKGTPLPPPSAPAAACIKLLYALSTHVSAQQVLAEAMRAACPSLHLPVPEHSPFLSSKLWLSRSAARGGC